jgi:hypothetical protein
VFAATPGVPGGTVVRLPDGITTLQDAADTLPAGDLLVVVLPVISFADCHLKRRICRPAQEGSMAVNRWWDADPAEVYWMEITGRDDLGANLAAPQTDERGEEYIGYTLVREVRDGDVVFHFDRNLGQGEVQGPADGRLAGLGGGRSADG